MVSVTAEIRMNGLNAQLRSLAASMKNRKPMLTEIGDFMVRSVQKNFDEQRSPAGDPWASLKRPRQIRGKVTTRRLAAVIATTRIGALGYRVTSFKILQDTGRLLHSIHRTATNDDVRIGTDVVYARVHQFGYAKKNIPARPYIGMRDGDEAAVLAIAERWQKREIALSGLVTK